jgi:ElaB/YqjD/DUF883 family membrane-anchored ribosome-binding protein
MPNSPTRKVKHELEDTLADVAQTLRQAADGLSDDAEKAIAQAAQGLRTAADALAQKASPETRYIAQKAVEEAKAHPIATAAAALSAAAALITLLGVTRKARK